MKADDIRFLRKKLGLSQQEFANRLHVSVSIVQKWEAARANPRGLYRDALLKLWDQEGMTFEDDPRGPNS